MTISSHLFEFVSLLCEYLTRKMNFENLISITNTFRRTFLLEHYAFFKRGHNKITNKSVGYVHFFR